MRECYWTIIKCFAQLRLSHDIYCKGPDVHWPWRGDDRLQGYWKSLGWDGAAEVSCCEGNSYPRRSRESSETSLATSKCDWLGDCSANHYSCTPSQVQSPRCKRHTCTLCAWISIWLCWTRPLLFSWNRKRKRDVSDFIWVLNFAHWKSSSSIQSQSSRCNANAMLLNDLLWRLAHTIKTSIPVYLFSQITINSCLKVL